MRKENHLRFSYDSHMKAYHTSYVLGWSSNLRSNNCT